MLFFGFPFSCSLPLVLSLPFSSSNLLNFSYFFFRFAVRQVLVYSLNDIIHLNAIKVRHSSLVAPRLKTLNCFIHWKCLFFRVVSQLLSLSFSFCLFFLVGLQSTGEMIVSSPKYNVQETSISPYEMRMTVTIRKFQREDIGSYRCIAKNSLGEVDSSIRLYGKFFEINWFLSPFGEPTIWRRKKRLLFCAKYFSRSFVSTIWNWLCINICVHFHFQATHN